MFFFNVLLINIKLLRTNAHEIFTKTKQFEQILNRDISNFYFECADGPVRIYVENKQ